LLNASASGVTGSLSRDRFVAGKFRFAVKIFPFILLKPSGLVRIFPFKFHQYETNQTMKSVVPIFLALIPLVAVVGACVAAP
jgi:hypothetical protein